MKKLLTLAVLLINSIVFAQPSCQWAYIPVGAVQTYNTIYNSTTDHSGNLIVTGILLGNADMDPGADPADTSFSTATYNYYISKTDSSGNLIWIHYFQNNSQIGLFEFVGLKVNSANEIVVVGNFTGLIDFDFSDAGVDTLRSHFPTYTDYFVAKYDPSGSYQWAFSIGDPTTSDIVAQAMTILPNDNIVIAANPNGTIDVDPGIAVHNNIGGNGNVICYDNNGNYVWNNNISNTTSYCILNNSLESDIGGNVFMATVGYYKLTLTAFDNAGSRSSEMTIGDFPAGARVNPQSLLTDKSTGEIYVAGTYGGMVDFDPGSNVVYRTSSSAMFQDGFIAKYDRFLNFIWVQTYEGECSFGNFSLDFYGADIAAVGNLAGTIDFGNSTILSASSSFSPFYIKLNSTGITQSGFTIDGFGRFNSIHSFPNNSFATTGLISDNTDMDPTSGTLILNATASNHFCAVYQSPVQTSVVENAIDIIVAYPNPAMNFVDLKISSRLFGETYTIYDITSKAVLSGELVTENTTINLENIASGIYTLKTGSNQEQTLRIVKE